MQSECIRFVRNNMKIIYSLCQYLSTIIYHLTAINLGVSDWLGHFYALAARGCPDGDGSIMASSRHALTLHRIAWFG